MRMQPPRRDKRVGIVVHADYHSAPERHGPIGPHGPVALVLEHAQQHLLSRQPQVLEVIEQQRAPARRGEVATPAPRRSRERPPHMPEQLARREGGVQLPRAHRHEVPVPPAPLVRQPRAERLPRPRCSDQDERRLGNGVESELPHRFQHRWRRGDERVPDVRGQGQFERQHRIERNPPHRKRKCGRALCRVVRHDAQTL